MPTQTLSGTYASGYVLTPAYDTWVFQASAKVQGSGVSGGMAQAYTIDNLGAIAAAGLYAGVGLMAGGRVVNGSNSQTASSIQGYDGVRIAGGAGMVVNHGSIVGDGAGGSAGVVLNQGGVVVNGSNASATALISGYNGVSVYGAAGSVVNFALIGSVAAGRDGVDLAAGGSVVNGTAGDSGAEIFGRRHAVSITGGAGTVTNFDVLLADSGSSTGIGVLLGAGGRVVNGTATTTTAVIASDGVGVSAGGTAATVNNYGTISGSIVGVDLTAGGVVINGSFADKIASIAGAAAIRMEAKGTVVNYGSISANAASTGIELDGGGVVFNHGQLSGDQGILGDGAPVAVYNEGTITAGATAVDLFDGGSVENGQPSNSGVMIQGLTGIVSLDGSIEVKNYGSIQASQFSGMALHGTTVGVGNAGSIYGKTHGIYLDAGQASIVNSGTISGGIGLDSAGAGPVTVVNSGLITGSGGVAIALASGDDRVVVHPGAQFGGKVDAGTGKDTLELAAGGLWGIGGIGTTFVNFETVQVDTGANWGLAGDNAITKAMSLVDFGTLGVTGTLTIAGSLTATGTIGGTGSLVLSGGTETFTGASLGMAHVSISNAAMTLSGSVANSGAISATTANLLVAATGATLTGAGSLTLTNLATNRLLGATSGAKFTNASQIFGAGQIGAGHMVLVNAASGVIDGNDATALIIDTGASAITNAGLIEAAGKGGVTIKSAVINTGVLMAAGGTLTLDGAVTGTGVGKINSGTLDFASTFTGAAVFTGATGILELAKSQAYTGAVTGLSKSGTNQLDLVDIAFTSGVTKASYSGTSASGTLTVTNGVHSAHIKLMGNYLGSSFLIGSDGHGGTLIHDPATPGPPAGGAAFIAAMAGFAGQAAAGHLAQIEDDRRLTPLALAGPRMAAWA
jgi:hypothetical protein